MLGRILLRWIGAVLGHILLRWIGAVLGRILLRVDWCCARP